MTGFSDLGLSKLALEALDAVGYAEPTPVQAAALPVLLSGRDALVEAPTGTGKTAAFALAVVERMRGPFSVLVLAPTRELASQVADEVTRLGRPRGWRAFAITGGVRESFQLDRMGSPECLVATPGRLLDLLEKDEITLSGVKAVVVDEADRMMDEGFLPEVEKLLAAAPVERQTMLFSATLPPAVVQLARRVARDPATVRVGDAPSAVVHHRLNVRDGEKTNALDAILRNETYDRALVFMRTRANVDFTVRELKARGIQADPLHGDRGDFERRHVTDLFRKGTARVVLATDVAARGLDVPELDLVVNFDCPRDVDQYVHRSGRTGRMGRAGKVVTFVTPDEKAYRVAIEERAGVTMVPYRLDVAATPMVAKPPPKPPRRRKPAVADEAPAKPKPRPSRESPVRRASRLGEERPRDRDGRARRR